MKTERPTVRRVLGMVIGIVIISLGIAIFKQSHLGNDSITALNIRLSELLGISLGVQNICTNLLFLVVEFIWGRKYIGLGTLVNGLGCGFIITFFYDIIAGWFGPAPCLSQRLAARCTRRPTWALHLTIRWLWPCRTTCTSLTSAAASLPMHSVRPSPSCWAAWSASAPWSAPSAWALSFNSSMARSLRRFCNINLWKLLDLFLRGVPH